MIPHLSASVGSPYSRCPTVSHWLHLSQLHKLILSQINLQIRDGLLVLPTELSIFLVPQGGKGEQKDCIDNLQVGICCNRNRRKRIEQSFTFEIVCCVGPVLTFKQNPRRCSGFQSDSRQRISLHMVTSTASKRMHKVSLHLTNPYNQHQSALLPHNVITIYIYNITIDGFRTDVCLTYLTVSIIKTRKRR